MKQPSSNPDCPFLHQLLDPVNKPDLPFSDDLTKIIETIDGLSNMQQRVGATCALALFALTIAVQMVPENEIADLLATINGMTADAYQSRDAVREGAAEELQAFLQQAEKGAVH